MLWEILLSVVSFYDLERTGIITMKNSSLGATDSMLFRLYYITMFFVCLVLYSSLLFAIKSTE